MNDRAHPGDPLNGGALQAPISASFTVVAATAGADEVEPDLARHAERRSIKRRLHDAAIVAVLGARSGTRRAEDSRRSDRRLAWFGAAALVLLAAAPWTVREAAWPNAQYLIAIMVVAAAFAGVAGLAPLKRMAAGAAALPLSPALANLIEPEAAHAALALDVTSRSHLISLFR